MADRRRNEAGAINVLVLAMIRRIDVASWDLIGAIPVVAIATVLKEGSGLVVCYRSTDPRSRKELFG